VGSREGVIQEGDTVTVNGHAVLEPHPGGAAVGARTTPMCPVLHAAGPHEPLLIAHDVGRARRP
jgi:hypothetical protein